LATCNGVLPPNASLPDDVACVRDVVTPLVDAGERVLKVMHSYGGLLGTDAVEGLSFSERQADGQPGGVIHLLYLCAYVLTPGTAIWDIVEEAGFAPMWDQYIDTAADGSTFPRDPDLAFFSGLSGPSVVDQARDTLVRFPMSALKTPAQGSAWRVVPVTYALTQQDYAVPRNYQDLMLQKIRGAGIHPRTEDYEASHSLFLTKQAEMVQLAWEAGQDPRNTIRA
jgi:hypothetical protein